MRTVWLVSAALAALTVVAVLTGSPRSENVPSDLPVAILPPARSFPFALYTHCGIDEALVDGVYFEAERPLIGEAFSAPPGWDNPYQRGRMTLPSPDRAVFRDDLGHEVAFHARPGATAFKRICD
ncbi:hypothetical protein [Amycolatopsis regifaucium]|uniref:Uncharacterized protein n=1 Tax=Amycolatopsis regifaucium TaxID=546365 RepID=A0A154M638_9PSEU|nr:hypothetical protein [Amycolatopsis regifaucium]KZB80091.1 hypothetical protein AVL48_13755 [Amycolatopsis regifaucium]OKA09539.1 hypothetical protein ATP06_0208795 [Amycolatopsis regifaucium]SFH64577.1 hypothetical protein SAMN04489731_105374 [Amycolatopsis regifaucium]